MDLKKLKEMLLNDKVLGPVYSYFLDHCIENLEFMKLGDKHTHPMLEATVAQISQQMYPRSGSIHGMCLLRLADEQFIHGGFTLGRRVGGFFFFEDCMTGLVALPDLPPSIEVKYARFAAKAVGPDPSRN